MLNAQQFASIRIDRACLYVVISFVLLPPPILENINDGLWSIINLSAVAICAVYFLLFVRDFSLRKVHHPVGILLISLVFLSIFIPNMINGVETRGYALVYARVLLAFFLFEHLFARGLLTFFVKIFASYCLCLLAANLISQIVYPQGVVPSSWESWQPLYVLTNANSFVFYYLFFVAMAVAAYSKSKKRSITVIVSLLVMLMTFSMLGESTSAAGLLVVAFILVAYLTPLFDVLLRAMQRGIAVFTVIVVLFVLIIIVGQSEWVMDFLNLIGVDTSTLVARTEIWNRALEVISHNQGFGAGTEVSQFSSGDGGLARSAHNTFLQILYYGGVLGLLAFFASMLPVFVEKNSTPLLDNRLLCSLRLFVVTFALMFLIEQKPFFAPYYYLLLLIPMLACEGSSDSENANLDEE